MTWRVASLNDSFSEIESKKSTDIHILKISAFQIAQNLSCILDGTHNTLQTAQLDPTLGGCRAEKEKTMAGKVVLN